jgi:putative PIN family toxin of toxin-antitoxin system
MLAAYCDSVYAVNWLRSGLDCMSVSVVLDTNVVTAALLRGGKAVRTILRGAFEGHYTPLMGSALFAEYQDVCARDAVFANSVLSAKERAEVVDALLSVSRWVEIYYLWRPNLGDEADNHLIELALAGGASVIVTRNVRDLVRGELRFPNLRILTPEQFLEHFPCPL